MLVEVVGALRRQVRRSLSIVAAALFAVAMTTCSGPGGRVVTPAYLERFEGGGSLSTLWYEGSDARYHYFRHLHRRSTPHRITREAMPWQKEFPFGSREVSKRDSLLTRQFSEFLAEQD